MANKFRLDQVVKVRPGTRLALEGKKVTISSVAPSGHFFGVTKKGKAVGFYHESDLITRGDERRMQKIAKRKSMRGGGGGGSQPRYPAGSSNGGQWS